MLVAFGACAPSRPPVTSTSPERHVVVPADDDWTALVAAFDAERWEDAYRRATDIEARYADDPDGRQAEVRYMELVALAGRVALRLARRDDFHAEAMRMIGQRLRSTRRPLLARPGSRDLGPTDADDPAAARHALDQVTTSTGNFVLLVDAIVLREPFDFARHGGGTAVVSGVLRTVQVRPAITRGVVAALALDDGVIVLAR